MYRSVNAASLCWACLGLCIAGDASLTQFPAQRSQPVARALINELFLGIDPLVGSQRKQSGEVVLDEGMTHVSPRDIDMVLALAPQPVSFWLELGAFEGGSAIQTARRVKERVQRERLQVQTAVLAVDTFLGDVRTLWDQAPGERRHLLRTDGTISLYDRFCDNVRHAGQADLILPMPATSVVALRHIATLAHRGVVPHPQVIYLDSAHEEGEVLLELDLAWKAVGEGGIVFGDDWVLAEGSVDNDQAKIRVGGGGPVQRDVLRFAETHAAELDDTLGDVAQPMRTLGRARPGLFVSYLSFQWFMKKKPHTKSTIKHTDDPVPSDGKPMGLTSPTFDCWSGGYRAEDCCDEDRFGQGGNQK